MRCWALGASVLGLTSAICGAPELAPTTNRSLLTIVYSADIDGYLEPCGCGGVNEGGIARQSTLLKRLRAQGPVLAISGGGFGGIPEAVSAMVKALAIMRYDCVVPSAADLEICPAVLDEAASLGVRALRRAAPSALVAPEVVEAAGLRVAIAGVPPPPEQPWPAIGLPEAGCDLLLVVADRAPRARLEALAQVLGTLPVDSVLLPAAGTASPAPLTARGRCLLPSLVARGRRLIALRCWRGPGDTGLRVAVSDEVVSADLAPDGELRALAADYYQQRQQTVLPALTPADAEGPGGATDPPLVLRVSESTAYVPAPGCGLCHPAQLERWRTSAHARAVQALDEAKRELPECLRCHSTRFAFAGELEAPPDAPGGVECASCHGGGRRHLATRLPKDVVAPVPANRCARCHTAEESPEFSDEYRSRLTCAEPAFEEVEP